MKKIAIATMVGQNHGNRLQNYALQAVLERMSGAQVETLRTVYGPGATNRCAKAVLRHVFPKKRWARFTTFDAQYIRFSRWRMDDAKLETAGYSLFVIGSDQVWNPTFDITGEAEYLPQVCKEKKVSYAASFGVDDVPAEDERTRNLLNDISRISVREETGQHIVRKLTGREASLVLDPVLLLTADDWLSVAQKPSLPVREGQYQLRYALGHGVAQPHAEDLQVVNLGDHTLPFGPAEFVWLVKNAACVCTDSYHATLFSLLMHTPFTTFRRESHNEDMSSRFETIERLAGGPLSHGGSDVVTGVEDAQDWAQIESNIQHERRRSLTFLEEALHDTNLL